MRGLLFMYTCVCLCMSPRSVGSFGLGVPGSCKLPDMGARNKTQVLYKNSVHSLLLNHISSSDCPLVLFIVITV